MLNNILKLRTKKGITQEKLARIVNCSLRQIQNIENNRSIPSILIAIKIKKALDIKDIEELFIMEEND